MQNLKNLVEDSSVVWKVYQTALEMALAVVPVLAAERYVLGRRRQQGKIVAKNLEAIIRKDPAFEKKLDQCLDFLSGSLTFSVFSGEEAVTERLVSACVSFVRLTLLAVRCDLDCQPEQRDDWIRKAYEVSAPNIRKLWPEVFPNMPRLL